MNTQMYPAWPHNTKQYRGAGSLQKILYHLASDVHTGTASFSEHTTHPLKRLRELSENNLLVRRVLTRNISMEDSFRSLEKMKSRGKNVPQVWYDYFMEAIDGQKGAGSRVYHARQFDVLLAELRQRVLDDPQGIPEVYHPLFPKD